MSKLAEADRAHLEKNFVEAIDLYRAVLAQDPGAFEAWYGLASALGSRLQYAEAIVAYRRALALRPRNAGVHVNLGSALSSLGYITDAVRNYRIAAAASEPEVRAMSLRNLACIAPGDPALDDARHPRHPTSLGRAGGREDFFPGTRHAVPGERLRIAYYGTFFADRNWMKMYMGVLNAHDRDRFEVNMIVDGALPSAASGYRDHENDRIWQVAGISNAELASHIAAAKIDVLIDLNGYSHTARLPLLLHRPAPLQIAWQGMYGTTGFPVCRFPDLR